jgi:hypothetical protein
MSSSVLKHQHSSLQYSDPEGQQRHDLKKIFEKGKQFPIKTGTESGSDNANYDLVEEFAKKFNHALVRYRANWVAVDRDIIKRNSVRKERIFVVDNSRLSGRGHDRGFPALGFTHVDERMGRIHVAGFHYSTHGRLPHDPNWDTNKMYAEMIEKWMEDSAKGTDIAIGAGDFNMIDKFKRQDWAFGGDFTSMGDELDQYPNTGHGPIDGFVSYDGDRRVKAKRFEALNDNRFKLFTDHYLIRGTWDVRHLKL